ncbi:hypothetical protein ABZ070_33605 [Streptomyces sp. NPDC006283]|uniref:hypothetical protein n=1 Tax=Streptomyces sp. NPDC006283 TaxID=3156741 RepID=UPI0033AF5288
MVNRDALKADDTDPTLTYTGSWTANKPSGQYNNAQHYTTTNGDSFSYTFTGTGIDYITTKATSRGKVDIYIDGALKQTANCYSATQQDQQVCASVRGLNNGKHTIKIKKVDGHHMSLNALGR